MSSLKPRALPIPPLKYYPHPPSEPVWREERQRHHVSSLHNYIGDLFLWMELCRSEMIFNRQNGIPVASQETCDEFLRLCVEFINEWMITLEQWTSPHDPF
jgi:hypothetical protein